ncbi:MAG: hypothetical protein LUH19_03845 [Lachnospiraceae bacterium]|nr:hypothetical protein [Lachnospiraceae bacterium]
MILYVYLLTMLILHASLEYCAVTKPFWLFLGVIAFFLTFLILYPCRNLADFRLSPPRNPDTPKGDSSNKPLLCGISSIYLLTAFFFIFACTDHFRSFHELDLILFLLSLLFAAAISYLALVLYKNGSSAVFLLGICLFLWLRLSLTQQTLFQYDDIALVVLAAILMAFHIQIVCSHGKWLQKTFHIVVFILVAALCVCTVRLAFLYVLPLTLTAVFYTVRSRKIRIVAIASILTASVILCCFSTYSRKENTSQSIPNTIGLHLSIWSNVMQTYPSALPWETQEFMYSLMPREVYDSYFLNSGFYSVSDSEQINYDTIASLPFTDILKYTYQCFRFAPKESLEALAFTTRSLWEIASGSHGPELLAILVVSIALLACNRLSALHICPLILYNLGTMFSLGGNRDGLYFLNTPLWLAVIFLMLKDETEFSSTTPRVERTGTDE